MADSLDDLPLDVLLAMQEAMANPTEQGVERARLRAKDAGFWLQCNNQPAALEEGTLPKAPSPPPQPMDPAPPGARGVTLDLSAGLSPVLSAARAAKRSDSGEP